MFKALLLPKIHISEFSLQRFFLTHTHPAPQTIPTRACLALFQSQTRTNPKTT